MTLIFPPDNWQAYVQSVLQSHEDRISKLESPPKPALILNRDLSTGDLSQYTHRDYGLGTDVVPTSQALAGWLAYHENVAGRRAAGLTVTPTSAASGNPSGSDGVYLWDPIQSWGTKGSEWWLRTSFLFPSAANLALVPPEAHFAATTGEWNWILELHKDKTTGPSEVTFDVLTDYPVTALPGVNPRMRMRLAYGNESNPSFIYKEAPALQFDHWYEFLLHEKLDPAVGMLEWFLDGVQMYSNLNVPTLFTHADGTISQVNLTVPNYRLHATWNSTFFLGPLCIAADKASALAAF
jgi:hypothetical protein